MAHNVHCDNTSYSVVESLKNSNFFKLYFSVWLGSFIAQFVFICSAQNHIRDKNRRRGSTESSENNIPSRKKIKTVSHTDKMIQGNVVCYFFESLWLFH